MLHKALSSVVRSITQPFRRWEPLTFPSKNYTRIHANEKIEEETYSDYVASRYYPTRIGEILGGDRYQVVGKLGFGTTSTIWLARDLRLAIPSREEDVSKRKDN